MSAASGGGGGAAGQGDPAVSGKLSTGDLDVDEMMLGFGDPSPGDGARDGAQDGEQGGEALGFGGPSPGVQGGVQEGAGQGNGGQGACLLHASGVGSALSADCVVVQARVGQAPCWLPWRTLGYDGCAGASVPRPPTVS